MSERMTELSPMRYLLMKNEAAEKRIEKLKAELEEQKRVNFHDELQRAKQQLEDERQIDGNYISRLKATSRAQSKENYRLKKRMKQYDRLETLVDILQETLDSIKKENGK